MTTSTKSPTSYLNQNSPKFLWISKTSNGLKAVFKSPDNLENIEFEFSKLEIYPTKNKKLFGLYLTKPTASLQGPNGEKLDIDLSKFYSVLAPSIYILITILILVLLLFGLCCFYLCRKLALKDKGKDKMINYEVEDGDYSGISDGVGIGFGDKYDDTDDEEEFKSGGNQEDLKLRARGVSKI